MATPWAGWADWPQTYYDRGKAAIIITGRHERPGLFQLWGGVYVLLAVWLLMAVSGGPLSLLSSWLYIVTGVTGASSPADNPRGWLCLALAIALPLAYRPFWKPLIVSLFGGKVHVEVTDDTVMIESEGARYRVPRRQFPEVGKEPHRLAREEARRQGTLARMAPVIYQDASEVVLRYGERRIVIAEMAWRDEAKADALSLRVQAAVLNFAGLAAALQAGVPASALPAAPASSISTSSSGFSVRPSLPSSPPVSRPPPADEPDTYG